MEQVVTKGEILYKRLSTIVERLMQENPVFQEALNSQAIVRMLLDAFNEPSPDNAIDLSEAELTKRVRFWMAIEANAGMLNDLTPEERMQFNRAVGRD